MTANAGLLGRPGYCFTNWSLTYSCWPELYFEPETIDEMIQILSFAREKGKKVKVVGSAHSPSDIACTQDFMVNLKKFNRVLSVDQEKQQVKVQGGISITELNKTLQENGLAMSVLGSVSDVTLAGAIATGTHGSGAEFGILGSYIVGVELLTASGEVMEVSSWANADLLPAVQCNLGCLGVIINITFQCEKAFSLHQTQYGCMLDQVLEHLEVHVSSSDHFRFLWFPHTEGVQVSHVRRTKKEEPVKKSSWFWKYGIGYYVLEFCYWLSTFLPFLVPIINQFFFKLLFTEHTEWVDTSHQIFNFECLFKQHVMEWSVPRSMCAYVLKELKSWIEQSKYPAHFPVEVRFVKGDSIYLSPANGRDTCYINIIMYRPYNRYVDKLKDRYWDAFQKIVSKVGGRPHWAKDHNYGPSEFKELYADIEKFSQLRKRLDPNGMFMNANLERIFGKN